MKLYKQIKRFESFVNEEFKTWPRQDCGSLSSSWLWEGRVKYAHYLATLKALMTIVSDLESSETEHDPELLKQARYVLKEVGKMAPTMNYENYHDKVFTILDAALELNVSTKTVSRWRTQGLRSFKTLGEDGRLRVGILESDLREFQQLNSAKTERGHSFSQLKSYEKVSILQESRRAVEDGSCPAEVTKIVADLFGRSVETVRYIIKEHDMLNSSNKIFHKINEPLSTLEKNHVFELWTSGMREKEIANSFCRTKHIISEIIIEKRLNRLACSISPLREVYNHDESNSFCLLPEDFIWSPDFEDVDEQEIMSDINISDCKKSKLKEISSEVSVNMDFYIESLYRNPLLTNEQTIQLFRKMNFLKWKIHNNLKDICSQDFVRITNKEMKALEDMAEQAKDVKNILVKSNLRLVVNIARRHSDTEDLFGLISDGNISLMRAVDKFDFTHGTRFSTYATAAISKNYSRTIPKELRTREKFKPTCDEVFQLQEDTRANIIEVETNIEYANKAVESLTSLLDSREYEIISLRFGLDYSKEPMTLKEVGAEVGLTKERVRQIAEQAMAKMRRVGTALDIYDF